MSSVAELTRECEALEREQNLAVYQFAKTIRPDRPEEWDQQTGFVGRNAKVAIAAGGNRSGKSWSAALKLARLVLFQQPPPWKNTPFVIVSDTLEQTCDICWAQNLEALIPLERIQPNGISWHDRGKNHPSRIKLTANWKDRPGCNWVIEFHALKQGRRNLQGRKVGGCWFSEQFEWPIFDEVLRGCAHTWYDGAQFAEFTPINPELCSAVEQRRKQSLKGQLPGWKFYRLNTNLNREHVDPGWFKSWYSQLDPNIRETRLTGAMPIFKGLVYPHFNPDIHVLDDAGWKRVTGKWFPGTDPHGDGKNRAPDSEGAGRYLLGNHFDMKAAFAPNTTHSRGTDWGFSADHPFCTEWMLTDRSGRCFFYDELFDPACTRTVERIEEIKNRWPWTNSMPDIYGMTYCDSSRPDLIDEFNIGGIPAVGATHTIERGVEHMRNLMSVERVGDAKGNEKLETKFYIYAPNCPNLIDQLTRYRYIEGISTGKNPHPGKPVPLKWQDDCCDSARYVIFGNRVPPLDEGIPSLFVSGDPERHGVHGARRR